MAKGALFGPKTARQLYDMLGKGPGYKQPPLFSSQDNVDEWPRVFRNDSGETVPAYGCMRVTDAQLIDGVYMLIIAKPNGTGGPFVFNNQMEVPSGKFGTYQRAGVVRAYYASGTVTVGDKWGPTTGWNVTASGDPKAVVVLGDVEANEILLGLSLEISGGQVLIKAPSGGIPQRVGSLLGSATCDVYDVNSVGQLADTGNNITVKNWGVNAACANGDRYGWAEFYDGVWWVVSEDCSDSGSQISASFTLTPNETGENDDFTTTSVGTITAIPRSVTYTPPVGVTPT